MAVQLGASNKIPSISPHAIVRDHTGMTQAMRRYIMQRNATKAGNSPLDADEVRHGWTRTPLVG